MCEFTQSCPTLCDHVDSNLPASSVHGILQARMLEWVAVSDSTTEYYSTTKKDEIRICSNMDGPETVKLSEVSQTETNVLRYHLLVDSKK